MLPMGFKKIYIREAEEGLKRKSNLKTITPGDIQHLPEILQKYLKFTGIVGNPQANNIRLRFAMKLRSKPNARWMNLQVQQFSFFDIPTRLFYMKANMMGIPPPDCIITGMETPPWKLKYFLFFR
jgi:hypothetical protein